jgi:hypothetical protein
VVDGITFRPVVGIDGFNILSSFDIDNFTCSKLQFPVQQIAIILYPEELINEKFLIKVRECVLKLNDEHPVKKRITSISKDKKLNSEFQKELDFLNEILNSPFNLITDQKIRSGVNNLIAHIPDDTNIDKLLKSYLFLMIGNITHSDNILKTLIRQSPREFYQSKSAKPSIYAPLALIHIEKILTKFSRHPADRLIFNLFISYLKAFINKSDLLESVSDFDLGNLDKKIWLAYTEKIAPDLVRELRLASLNLVDRNNLLRDSEKYSVKMQSYWIWPFLEVTPILSEKLVDEIVAIEKTDPLWVVYFIADERLQDLYFKRSGLGLKQRRQFLRDGLKNEKDFMLVLYKLIEMGDIDEGLVTKLSDFVVHE